MPKTASRKRSVKGSGKDAREISIEVKDDGRLGVTWLCGANYTFTLEDAIERFARAQNHADRWEGVWLEDSDSIGGEYAIKVEGGKFYGEDATTPSPVNCVSWVNFKNAVNASITLAQKEFDQQQQEGSKVST